MRAADNECDIQCNLMWDGFGRWVTGFKWKPYINFTRQGKQNQYVNVILVYEGT